MNLLTKFGLLLVLLIFSVLSQAAYAQSKVVVIPLLGDSTELKPIKFSNLIEERRAFTRFSDKLTIGTVTDTRKFVITSITVAPENYPSTLSPISLRFCVNRPSGSTNCTHSFKVPNNTISKIDYGFGDLFTSNGQHYIDLTSRGGLPQNVANQIVVFVSGYFYNV